MKFVANKIWQNFKAIFFGLLAGLLICEIILRIYNPFPFSIKKGKLILPANQHKVFENKWISKLDKQIHYSRNSLGFRGPEAPDSVSSLLSFITVGGSTTECKFLSDSATWPFRLYLMLKNVNGRVWLNNAGMDGHSTYGHLLLVNEYLLKMKPKYILFMTGINDEEIERPELFDLMTEKKVNTQSIKGFIKSLLNYSELGRTCFNFYHVQIAYRKGLIHREIRFQDLVENKLADSVMTRELSKQIPFVRAYRERIDNLVNSCLKSGIMPILITQASLFGSYTDSLTGINVTNLWPEKGADDNCALHRKKLQLYNDVLLSYRDKIDVIDLAAEMPTNSLYYYDFTHFTNQGAQKVASILSSHLFPLVENAN